MQRGRRHVKQSVDLSAAFAITEALRAVLVAPECILIACLVGPSPAAGAWPLLIPWSVSDREGGGERAAQ